MVGALDTGALVTGAFVVGALVVGALVGAFVVGARVEAVGDGVAVTVGAAVGDSVGADVKTSNPWAATGVVVSMAVTSMPLTVGFSTVPCLNVNVMLGAVVWTKTSSTSGLPHPTLLVMSRSATAWTPSMSM